MQNAILTLLESSKHSFERIFFSFLISNVHKLGEWSCFVLCFYFLFIPLLHPLARNARKMQINYRARNLLHRLPVFSGYRTNADDDKAGGINLVW